MGPPSPTPVFSSPVRRPTPGIVDPTGMRLGVATSRRRCTFRGNGSAKTGRVRGHKSSGTVSAFGRPYIPPGCWPYARPGKAAPAPSARGRSVVRVDVSDRAWDCSQCRVPRLGDAVDSGHGRRTAPRVVGK